VSNDAVGGDERPALNDDNLHSLLPVAGDFQRQALRPPAGSGADHHDLLAPLLHGNLLANAEVTIERLREQVPWVSPASCHRPRP